MSIIVRFVFQMTRRAGRRADKLVVIDFAHWRPGCGAMTRFTRVGRR